MSSVVEAQSAEGVSKSKEAEDGKSLSTKEIVDRDFWLIRPCFLYKNEYKVCKSVKGRVHQYYVTGQIEDCSEWHKNYQDCEKWRKEDNDVAGLRLINAEKDRKQRRLSTFYENDTWEHRTKPPEDWDSPLPDFLQERYKGSYLSSKVEEFTGPNDFTRAARCVVM